MYEHFFGFRERPFDLAPDPRFLVLTDSHAEVLSTLKYGIASRKGITLLTGEAGSGKTTLLRAALVAQPERVHCVQLNNPTLSRQEFVEMLAARFGLSGRAAESKTAFLLEFEALLRERRKRGETNVLVVDEAQSLPLELLEEIRLLVNIETDEDRLLSVIIAGQPELADRLNDPALRQFKQRVALRCELRRLTGPETAGYIAGRIGAAGGVASRIFTREAVELIFERSGGVPRTISVIADNALLGGFADNACPVGAAIVTDVCRDFDLSAHQFEAAPGPARPRSSDWRPAGGTVGPHEWRPFGEPSDRQDWRPLTARTEANGWHALNPTTAGKSESAPQTETAGGVADRESLFESFAPKKRRFFFFGN
jgi:general secretion pathway protein A